MRIQNAFADWIVIYSNRNYIKCMTLAASAALTYFVICSIFRCVLTFKSEQPEATIVILPITFLIHLNICIMTIGKGLAINSIVASAVCVCRSCLYSYPHPYIWSSRKIATDQKFVQKNTQKSIDFTYQSIPKNGQDNTGKSSSIIQTFVGIFFEAAAVPVMMVLVVTAITTY